jgi:hypothetical protein
MFSHPDYDGHEALLFTKDAASGLRALIAIHDTTLGPAFGGCRITADDVGTTLAYRAQRGMCQAHLDHAARNVNKTSGERGLRPGSLVK